MGAQACHGRLMFSKFELQLEYHWNAVLDYVWSNDGHGNPQWASVTDLFNGTWGHKVPKLDFTKRQLNCANLMADAKAKAVDGWVHKSFDEPVARDFGPKYPFPPPGSEGWGYFAQNLAENYVETEQSGPNELPLINYYALQPDTYYRTDTKGEPVPLFNKLRVRQGLFPLINSFIVDYSFNNANYGFFTPIFYYLVETISDPYFGYPPNWPTDTEQPAPDGVFLYLLTPNKAVCENQNEYQRWLATNLSGFKAPIYFPGAPNDPMLWNYDEPVKTDSDKTNFLSWRAQQKNAPETFFATEKKWTDFLAARMQNNQTPCGGRQQCGVAMSLVNADDMVINCKSTADFAADPDGPSPPPKPWEGTSQIKVLNPEADFPLLMGLGPYRDFVKLPPGLPYRKVNATGNDIFTPWQASPPLSNNVYSRNQFIYYNLENLPFFNSNQKECQRYFNQFEKIGLPINWHLRWLPPDGNGFSNVEGWLPGQANTGLIPLDVGYPTPTFTHTKTESGGILTWDASGQSYEDENPAYKFKVEGGVKLTITYEDL
jgi:hypothetical protein